MYMQQLFLSGTPDLSSFISSLLVLVPDFTRYPYKPYIDPYSRRAGFRYMYIWLGLNLWIESGLPKIRIQLYVAFIIYTAPLADWH